MQPSARTRSKTFLWSVMPKLPCLRQRQLDDLRFAMALFKAHRGHCHRQLETAGAGAAWIDEQYPLTLFNHRLMRVAGYDRDETSRRRIEIQVIEIVQEVDRLRSHFYDICSR